MRGIIGKEWGQVKAGPGRPVVGERRPSDDSRSAAGPKGEPAAIAGGESWGLPSIVITALEGYNGAEPANPRGLSSAAEGTVTGKPCCTAT